MRYDLSRTRFWLTLCNFVGLIISIFTLAMMLFGLQTILDKADSYEGINTIIWVFVIVALISAASIYLQIVLIRFIRTSTDEELIGNRYILALFSLGLGGIMTPFMLTQMPNVDSESKDNPRYTLSKHYGMAALIGGISAIAFFFLMKQKYHSELEFTNAFDIKATGVQIVLAISAVSFVWGALTVPLFWTKGAKARFDAQEGMLYNLMAFVAIINLIVGTLVLVMLMVKAFINLLNAISRLFESRGGFDMFIALLNLVFVIWYVTFIISIAAQTIKGIWSKNNVVAYKVYTKFDEAKQNREYNNR
ncbi:hypothetical protein [Spiroplasma endosymbiont of Crioceris asparagi]|uniref:hypothetical protein n=1 Tax=Spiroplasma endosymbiont of Crioceris asparagi TaxID=3066286 RepID=UPI0030D2E747